MSHERWVVEHFMIAKMEQQWENSVCPVCYKCRHYVKGELICVKTNKIIPEELTCEKFDLSWDILNNSWRKDK